VHNIKKGWSNGCLALLTKRERTECVDTGKIPRA